MGLISRTLARNHPRCLGRSQLLLIKGGHLEGIEYNPLGWETRSPAQ